jgi:GT2 family glycosyltransferase
VETVIAHWQDELPHLELVEDHSHASPGHARNIGAAQARHPGILFLDDDDVADAGYVEAMGAALDDSELSAARIDLSRLNPPALVSRWGEMQAGGPMTHHDFLPWTPSAALGVRREVFEQVGGFDPALPICEDTDLCWRAQLDAGARLSFVPAAVLSYRLRTTPGAAFRQARTWASWEAALLKRYRTRGLPSPGSQGRALLRWGRPLLLLARARRAEDLVVVARLLGACIGRAEGSIRHRYLHL